MNTSTRQSLRLAETSLFRQQACIDGRWCDADSGHCLKVRNPATSELIGTVPDLGAAQTRRAIAAADAADAAMPAWRVKTAKERARILRQWNDLMMANQEDLAQLMTAEQGKPLAERVRALEVGNDAEAGVAIGPQIDGAALAKVEEQVADALAKGARLVLGGQRHALGGTICEPTILADVDPTMKVTREETFGPVAPLFRFREESEAVRMANDTEFGLTSYFYARDMSRIWRVSEGLEYGMVGINTGLISNEVAPFGGVEESGTGREGSKYGIEACLEIKYRCMSI